MDGIMIAEEKDATSIVNSLSTNKRKEILQVLSKHVHPDHRVDPKNSKKELISWP